MGLWYECGNGYALAQFAKKDIGCDTYLVCPGPSLKNVDSSKLRGRGRKIFAINTAYPYVKPDVWMGLDKIECYDRNLWYEPFMKICRGTYYDELELDGKKLKYYPDVYWASLKEPEKNKTLFDYRSHKVNFVWYKNTMAAMLHVMVWMGARTIHLIGCDMGGTKDYYDDRVLSDEQRNYNRRLYKEQVKFIRTFNEQAKKYSISVISCTPDSPLNEFLPYKDVEVALKDSEDKTIVKVENKIVHALDTVKKDNVEVKELWSGGDNPEVTVIIPYKEDRGWQKDAIATVPKNVQLLLSKGNGKGCVQANKALKQAKGKYIKFLHDDDLLTPNAIEDSLKAIKEQNADFIHGKAINFKEDSKEEWIDKVKNINPSYEELKKENTIHGGTTLYRKDVFDRVGGYDETLEHSEEYELHLRCLYNGLKLGYVDSVVYKYRMHKNQKVQEYRTNPKLRDAIHAQIRAKVERIDNIFLVLKSGGDFGISDVSLISNYVNKYNKGIKVYCLHDLEVVPELENVEFIRMSNLWKGWWAKMNLFSPELEQYRPFLYLDLDTALLKNIKHIIDKVYNDNKLVLLRDFYYPKKTASGVMYIPKANKEVENIWNTWIVSVEEHISKYRGDQDFIGSVVKNYKLWQDITDEIITFKPLVNNKVELLKNKPDASIVCFHGKPRIKDADIEWVKNYVNSKVLHLVVTRLALKWRFEETGLSWNDWLQQSIEFMDTYCRPSLRNQSNQDFTLLSIVDESVDYIGNKLDNEVVLRINTSTDHEFNRTQMINKINEYVKEVGNVDSVIITRLDRDDCLHYQFLEKVRSYLTENDNFIDLNYLFTYDHNTKTAYNSTAFLNKIVSPFVSTREKVTNEKLKCISLLVDHGHVPIFLKGKKTNDLLAMQVIHPTNLKNQLQGSVTEINYNDYGIN